MQVAVSPMVKVETVPEGTTAIVYILISRFSGGSTFIVPKSGKYRVTCIGAGGSGASGQSPIAPNNYNTSGGGGGAGGVSQSILTLNKGQSIQVTTSGKTYSFGTYLSATCGSDGKQSGSTGGGEGGAGGVGTNGNLYNISNINGSNAQSGESSYGGTGGYYSYSDVQNIPLLSGYSVSGSRVTSSNVSLPSAFTPSNSGLFPFGIGGGGGSATSAGNYRIVSPGSPGAPGAVIVEIVLE